MAGNKVKRSGVAYTAKSAAARHKRPCRSAPATPANEDLLFVRQTVHKRHVWTAKAVWDAVTEDVAGRTLSIEGYQVQLRATDASGEAVETNLQTKRASANGDDFSVDAGSAPTSGHARLIDNSGSDRIKKVLSGLTAGVEVRVEFMARRSSGTAISVTCSIRDTTAGATVATKNGSPDSTRHSRLIATMAFTPTAGHTYEARVEYNSGSGVAKFDQVRWHDAGSAAVWDQFVHGDDPDHALFRGIPNPKSWFYQMRVRALNRIHGGRCWSAWTDWTTAQIPTDDDTTLGPPAPDGLILEMKRDAPQTNPWRARCIWNETPHWVEPDGDSREGASRYQVVFQTAASDGGTVMHTRHTTVLATEDGTVAETSFFGIKGKRWYRFKVAAVDADGNVGAFSSFTSWSSPHGAPADPTSVSVDNPTPRKLVVSWTPPSDDTDVAKYRVVVIRQGGGGTTVKTAYVSRNTTEYHYNITAAEYAAHPTANYRAEVTSIEDDYFSDVDDVSTGTQTGDSGTPVSNGADVPNNAVWTNAEVTTTDGPITDGDPPSAVSAAPTLHAGPRWIAAHWDAVSNNDPVTYEVHVSETSSFTPDATTLVGELAGTVTFIRTANADGDPLAYGVLYYVKVIAKDADGSASASPANDPGIELDPNVADDIAAGSITVDKLAAVLIITNALKTAETGRRVNIDDTGITLVDSDETVLVSLPTDADSPASFQGELLAESLTATGAAEFRSASNTLTKDAVLTLLAGQQAPAAAPTLSTDYQSVAIAPTEAEAASERSAFGYDPASGYLYYVWNEGLTAPHHFVRVDPATGAEVDRTTMSLVGDYSSMQGGMVHIGSYWYGIAISNLGTPDFLIWDDSGNKPSGTPTSRNFHSDWTGWFMPHVATDGTDLYVCQSDTTPIGGTTKAQFLRYTVSAKTAPSLVSTRLSSNTGPGSADIVGYYRGSGDFGAARNVVVTRLSSTVRVYDTANPSAAQSNSNWTAAFTPNTWSGFAFDGTNFWHLSTSGQAMYKYSLFVAQSGTSDVYWAAFTWYDSDSTGGTHETALSPRASITWANRKRLSVSWPTIPDSGGTDDADNVRIYLKENATDPGSTFASYYRQGGGASGTQVYKYQYSTGTVGSQDTAFPGGGGGSIKPYDDDTQGGELFAPLLGSGDGFVPRGAIMMWPLSRTPTGWLRCDGSAVSRNTYEKLYDALTYGVTRTTPTVRAVGTVANGTGDVAPGLPAGNTAGDLLLCFVEHDGANGQPSMTGWTHSGATSSTTGTRIDVFYKIAAGGDATTVTDCGDHTQARIVGITGGTWDSRYTSGVYVNPVKLLGAAANATGVTFPTGSTLNDNAMVFMAASGATPDASGTTEFSSFADASLAGVTERVDNTCADGNGGALFVGTGTLATAGSVGTATVTAATSTPHAAVGFYIDGAQALSGGFADGDKATTFTLPTFSDRIPVGVNTLPLGTNAAQAHSTAGNHNHDGHGAAIPDHATATNTTTGGGGTRVTGGSHSGTHAGEGGHTHDSHGVTTGLPPAQVVYFIIKT